MIYIHIDTHINIYNIYDVSIIERNYLQTKINDKLKVFVKPNTKKSI